MPALLKVLIPTCAVALLLAGCDASKRPRDLYESEGGFSYDPPENWHIARIAGLKYRISHGAAENGFGPNINVVDENFPGTLDAYADANMATWKRMIPNGRILARMSLQTDDGAPAVCLLTEDEQNGRKLRQTFYVFGTGERKYVATCTALANGGERFDSLFLKSMKTFRIH